MMNSLHNQRGVSLIDAMIAAIIFSFGLLAITALQIMTKQSNHEAMQRSYAAYMAYDLLERVRLNSAYPDTLTTAPPLSRYLSSTWLNSAVSESSSTTPDCSTANCSYLQRADWDVLEWRKALTGFSESSAANDAAGGLVDPVVCFEPTGGQASGERGEYTLTIVWRGQTAIKDDRIDFCGDGRYGSNNEFRRVMQLSTYLTDYQLK